ncbi:unknown similar to AMEV165 [Mythimna separata entomopoxvirus 'L']|uniref:Uncharacterized protein n=1 Tax=Mythimna separata entomopoxvirus 'L' TaxID=1293572 RepID=A0A916KQ87_9POXV|nr:unknown similar to AMEV165 [Mythimna separata entomopoxvirus 'L']CCU56399.1 unknown similar to AMEV165 [Mythimna separata entomopoxvirus 'L']
MYEVLPVSKNPSVEINDNKVSFVKNDEIKKNQMVLKNLFPKQKIKKLKILVILFKKKIKEPEITPFLDEHKKETVEKKKVEVKLCMRDIKNDKNNLIKTRELPDIPSHNNHPIKDIIKKKILTNYTRNLHISLFILNCIGLLIVVLLNGCESFNISAIICMIISINYIYYILLILIHYTIKIPMIIKKIIVITLICIPLFMIVFSSLLLSIELFDTNEYCSKTFRAIMIITNCINLLWALIHNILVIIDYVFNKNIIGINRHFTNLMKP